MRTLAVDYGDRRVGLAISDETGMFAHVFSVLEIDDVYDCVERISAVVYEKKVEEVVVGLPKRMNNVIGARAKVTLEFVEELKQAVDVPVVTWDERLTTVQAQGLLDETGISRKDQRGRIDAVAAQILLQSYLDAKKSGAGGRT